MLDEKFISLVEEAEKKKDINLVVQANAWKRKNEETEEERRKLEETLKVMIEKRKKLFDYSSVCILASELCLKGFYVY